MANTANKHFGAQTAWRHEEAVVERASRIDVALTGENILDGAKNASETSNV